MRALEETVFAIVGLGLMGGSFALALRERRACKAILGITIDAAARERALSLKVVEETSADIRLAAEADVIILATPVRTILRQLPAVGAIARAGTLILDLGSTKRDIARAMEQLPARVQPIGGHPMCGKERAGFAAAQGSLYENAPFVLTPLARTSPETLELAKGIVATIGARPLVLDATRHDKIMAVISHLPFVLAAALMASAEQASQTDDRVYALAAGGFRDTTRLAASDSNMMVDILLTNGGNIAGQMRNLASRLEVWADLIERRDESALSVLLQAAADRRRLYQSEVT